MARNRNGPWSPIYGQAWTHQQTRASSAVVREQVKRPTTPEVAPFLVLGWLNRINIWCLANNEQGGIGGLSDVMLAAVAWPEAIEAGRRPAEVGQAIRAALRAGAFLDGAGEEERVHNFRRHHARLLGDRDNKRSAEDSTEESADGSTEASTDTSTDGSTEPSRSTVPKSTVPKSTEEEEPPTPSGPPGTGKPAKSPAEAAARALATALGSSLRPCRDQIRALQAAGWSIERIHAAIAEHAEPGLSPWDWTKRAVGKAPPGQGRPGATGASLHEWARSRDARKDTA